MREVAKSFFELVSSIARAFAINFFNFAIINRIKFIDKILFFETIDFFKSKRFAKLSSIVRILN